MNLIITLLRKPLEGTVARNVLQYGTGGLNIDGSRIALPEGDGWDVPQSALNSPTGLVYGFQTGVGRVEGVRATPDDGGRWPANLILTAQGASGLDADVGVQKSGVAIGRNASAGNIYGGGKGLVSQGKGSENLGYGDLGGPSRYFKTVPDRE